MNQISEAAIRKFHRACRLLNEAVEEARETCPGARLYLAEDQDGRSMGNTTGSLHEATPEAVAEVRNEIRKNQLAASLGNVRWRSLPLSVLEQVNAVLEAHAQSKEGE